MVKQPAKLFWWKINGPESGKYSFSFIAEEFKATAIFTIAVFLGSTISSLPSGTLSDKWGRGAILTFSIICQMVPTFGFP